MSMYRHNERRILRPMPPTYFPSKDIVAVLSPIENIVYFNTTFTGDSILERRALFLDEPVLRLPPKYQPSRAHWWDGYIG